MATEVIFMVTKIEVILTIFIAYFSLSRKSKIRPVLILDLDRNLFKFVYHVLDIPIGQFLFWYLQMDLLIPIYPDDQMRVLF